MKASYIGITGFNQPAEIREVFAALQARSTICKHRLMTGVLVDGHDPYNERPRYPAPELVSTIFVNLPGVIGLAHLRPHRDKPLSEELSRVSDMCRLNYPAMQGVQINHNLPEPEEIRRWRTQCETARQPQTVVFQVGPKTFLSLNDCPEAVAELLRTRYDGLIDYALLDVSGGVGKKLDVNTLLPYLRQVRTQCPDLALVVAGGLCADNVHDLEPLVAEFPDVSIDAEGRLRDANDRLDVPAAIAYVQAAQELFTKYQD